MKENAISGYLSFKPTYIDDTFWDITGLIENKKRPLSFRINAAFHVHSLNFYHYNIEISDMTNPYPELTKLFDEIEYKIENESQKILDVDFYLRELLFEETHNYIGIITVLIYQKQYRTALEKINQYKLLEDIHFQYNFHQVANDGVKVEKSFLELAEEFCLKQLSIIN